MTAQFVRPRGPEDARIWGVEGGIVVGVHPDFKDPLDRVGPRGLLRVGLLREGRPRLVNFIAVEPLVGRARGLSELERSAADGRPGKRFALSNDPKEAPSAERTSPIGLISETPEGKALRFAIHVEAFANGARPIIEVALFEKHPRRVRFRTFLAEGSAEVDQLTLTATMGNMARCRNLWLSGTPVHAFDLYRGYRGRGFVERGIHPLERIHRTATGAAVVAITPDEFDASEARPFANGAWRCPVEWMTQYWWKPKGSFDDTLSCRVNGRRVYWRSSTPLPAGVAYENFELRERFRSGQETWFGFDSRSPAAAFGFDGDLPPGKAVLRRLSQTERSILKRVKDARRSLINGDFRRGLQGWSAAPDPSPFRVFSVGDEKRLTTFGAGRDTDEGRLSQSFFVPPEARELRFFVHGGCDPRRLRLNLWRGERLVRWMTGHDQNTPIEVRFALSPHRGEVLTFEIVDASRERWGFLGVHGIEVMP